MSAVSEQFAPRLDTEKKKGFLTAHPYVAAAVAAIMCLCVAQNYQESEYVYIKTLSGQLNLIRPAPALALSMLVLVWAWDFIKQLETRLLWRAVYIGGAIGAEFLLWRFFAVDEALLYGLPVLLAALNVFDFWKQKKASGVLLLSVALACAAVFGFNIWVYFGCAVAGACFAWLRGLDFKLWKRLIAAAAPLAGAVGAYLVYVDSTQETRAKMLLVAAIIIIAAATVSVAVYEGLTGEQIVFALFAVGFALRLCYVLKIMGTQNQHDVWPITDTETPKHNLYIRYIYENGALPQTKESLEYGLTQYYHPPLHHALAALWMRIQTFMGIDFYVAYENVQYLTVFYSTAIMVASKKLFEELGLKKTGLVVACAIIAFHPTFFILAGSVNNDVLCVLFFVLSMLYSIRFYKKQSIGNTVALALCIGLGMMTKLNVALVAVGTGALFIYMLFCKKNGGFGVSFKRLWKRFVLFGVICVPLGLWWSVYTYLRFDLPLGFVPSLSASPRNPQYIYGKGVFERIFGFESLRMGNIYPNIGLSGINGEAGVKYYDYGILPYSVKSSLFGEYFTKHRMTDIQNIIGYVLMIGTLLLIALALFGMLKCLLGNKKAEFSALKPDFNGSCDCKTVARNGEKKVAEKEYGISDESVAHLYLLGCYGVLMLSYIYFCFSYPFTCTMDFRYVVPVLPITAYFIGKLVDADSPIKNKKLRTAFRITAVTATAVFAIASMSIYASCF